MSTSQIFPCEICGHHDCRDLSHAKGCPQLAPVSQSRLIALAHQVERGWREDNGRRRQAAAERRALNAARGNPRENPHEAERRAGA